MTKVTWVENDGMMEIRMEGHSEGKRENGRDLVCAACSALGCALAGMVQGEGEGSAVQGPGRLRITMRANRKTREWARVIIKGYEMLAEQYPENVQVEG